MATLTYIDLFAGVSMLGQGFESGCRYLGVEARCLCHVEGDIYAAGVLAARMQEGSLTEAPIHSDVKTFRGRKLRGYVDAIIGGFPCQDLSVAGKRAGISGEKSGLWEEFRRLIREIKPGIVWIENVPGMATSLTLLHHAEIMGHLAGLQRAAQDAPSAKERWYIERHHDRLYGRLLKIHGIPALLYIQACLGEMDYESQCGFFSASEVKAPHERKRVWILSYRKGGRFRELREPSGGTRFIDGHGSDVADGNERHQPPGQAIRAGRGTVDNGSGQLENSARDGRDRPHGESGRWRGVREADIPVANPSNRQLQEQGRGPGRRAWVGSASEIMGDTERSRRTAAGIGCGLDTGGEPKTGCGSVADPSIPRLPQRSTAGESPKLATTERTGDGDLEYATPSDRTQQRQHRDNLPRQAGLFPPGPSNRAAWSRMPAHLAPAIEPGLRLHLDGDAVVLDASGTDQLRCGGNGVVALTAGYAFVTLARRAGIT